MRKLLLSLLLVLALSTAAFADGAAHSAGYQGSFGIGVIFDFKFTTVVASTGVPATLGGVPVISWYQDNGTTEGTTGLTLTVDFDARTGLNNVRVDTTGLTAGNYTVVITTGTVGTSVVGYEVGSFAVQTSHDSGTTLQKNVALANFPFVMYSTSSGQPLAGLTVTCQVSKDGGAFGACTNAVAEVSAGLYKISLAAADVNAATLALKFTATGARPTIIPIVTQQ